MISQQNSGRCSRYLDHTRFKALSDEELIEKVRSGEPELYEVIIRRHNQKLYRIIRSYLADDSATMDAMQVTYMKAFEKLQQFRGESQFATWLVRIAINVALMELRRSSASPTVSVTDLSEMNQKELVDKQDPAMKTEQRELGKLLEEAVDALPPIYRSVFVMREVEEMSTAEVAECLQITPSNVKIRLHRSREMLQRHLKAQCGDLYPFLGERCDRMVASVMEQISR